MADNKKIYDQFDDKVQYMIIYAKAASIDANVDKIYPESFVIGLLTMGNNDVSQALIKKNIDLKKTLQLFKKQLVDSRPQRDKNNPHCDKVTPHKSVKDVCILASKIGKDLNHNSIGIHLVFLAMLELCPEVEKGFASMELDVDSFKKELKNAGGVQPNRTRSSRVSDRAKRTKEDSAIEAFCIDMTKEAEENKYDPILLRDNEIEEAITILCRRNKSNPILVGEPGVGKCLAKGTKVRMHDGSLKCVEDIKIGDELMGADSSPRKVLATGQGMDDMFKVCQKRGEDYVVNSEHILSLVQNKKNKRLYKEITVKDWLNQTETAKLRWKGWKTGVEYEEKAVKIDPYMLGLWLGDGMSCKSGVTNIDVEVVKYLEHFAHVNGYNLRQEGISYLFSQKNEIHQLDMNGNVINVFDTVSAAHAHIHNRKKVPVHSTIYDCLNGTQRTAYGYKWFRQSVNPYGLHTLLKQIKTFDNKHIPSDYLFNSSSVRLKVLAGLIDSDGYLIHNCYEISQKNKNLALQIIELGRSLGFYCSFKEKVVNDTVYYRMNICGAIDSIPCIVSRKRPSLIKKNKDPLASGISVESLGEGEYYGFNIDGDGLFLLEDFTVTHNTAIAEGICQRIISQTVPKKLRKARIFSMEMGTLVAGTKFRGEFENRLKSIIEELRENPHYILFIDEIHSLIGAGSASGSVDAANMLKPELARGLKCVGATTNAEYKKIFSNDGALDRRFEKVKIDPPSAEQTVRILSGIRSRLEKYHNCIITDDAIDTAVKLTGRYKPEKYFPDKAIDCIDTACAKFAWLDEDHSQITGQDVAVIISKQCKIPIEMLLWDNYARVQNTEDRLKEIVVAQDHAVAAISRVLKKSYSGIRDPNKPIGVFVFGGESGTGKTLTSKELAKTLFDSEASFIKLDMTEFSEEHSVSKIMGSPPGYVGFNDSNIVADRIRNRPYSVLLLDEIEKAHPKVIKFFLQMMKEGIFTDTNGEKVNCKNLIIIMTGNFNMHEATKSSLGFGNEEVQSDELIQKNKLIDFCKREYGAEFINRVDDFIAFNHIKDEDLEKISRLELMKLINRINRKDLTVSFDEDVPKFLVKLSKKEHGLNAMVIERLISKYVEPSLADVLIKLEIKPEIYYNSIIKVKNDQIVVSKRQQRRKK